MSMTDHYLDVGDSPNVKEKQKTFLMQVFDELRCQEDIILQLHYKLYNKNEELYGPLPQVEKEAATLSDTEGMVEAVRNMLAKTKEMLLLLESDIDTIKNI